MNIAKLKRSPWSKPFSTEVPAQPGAYECEWTADTLSTSRYDTWFNYWDGKHLHWGSADPGECDRDDPIKAAIVADGMRRWRGITEAEARRLGMTT